MREQGAKRREATRGRSGRFPAPSLVIHGMAAVWLAWITGATVYAGGNPAPWLWGMYILGAYALVYGMSSKWRWPVLVAGTFAAWWADFWIAGYTALGMNRVGVPFGVGSPTGGLGSPGLVGAAVVQGSQVLHRLVEGNWFQALAEAQGPLGRLVALFLCGLTAWAFARSVERGLLWTWLLAGETVLALTDAFLVNQTPALIGTVMIGVVLAAVSRGFWWGLPRHFPWRALVSGLGVAVLATGLGILVPKPGPVWPDPLQWFGGRSGSSVKKIGYGQNDLELGGPFVADETVAFTVEAPEPTYYRGETRDVYTGHGWAAKTPIAVDPRMYRALFEGRGDPWAPEGALRGVPTKTVRQQITVENGPLPVVVAAYPLTRILEVTVSHQVTFRTDPHGAWVTLGNLAAGDRYTVESSVPAVVPDGLKRALPAPPGALPPAVRDDLQLPAEVPARVRELAWRVTAREETAYGKARAIADYLKSHYRYETRQVPVPRPGQDFVDQFLFESNAGYCDHFSTAMAVMARSVGLPARWVKGFAPGEPDPQQPEGAAVRRFLVRNSNAHSWVEVWIPGYGWVPFDPTPGVGQAAGDSLSPVSGGGTSGGQDPPGTSPETPANADRPSAGQGTDVPRDADRAAGSGGMAGSARSVALSAVHVPSTAILAGLAALVGAALAASALWRFRRGRRGWRYRIHPAWRVLLAGPPPSGPEEAVERLQQWYVRRGGVLEPGTTVRTMMEALVREAPHTAGRAARLLRELEAAQYGRLRDRPEGEIPTLWKELAEAVVGKPDGRRQETAD
ncbi:MAG: hypothetical protein IRY98_05285 [Alicyclobacillaceae bacterium]|nr:hypothetical protein [Alicyclobacillaceae bacterium]